MYQSALGQSTRRARLAVIIGTASALLIGIATPALGVEGDQEATASEEREVTDAPSFDSRATPQQLDDPLWSGAELPDPRDEPSTDALQRSAAGSPPLRTNAIGAALTDPITQAVYGATRDAVPAQLFIRERTSTRSESKKLPVGVGAWDIAQSGSTIAIGIMASRTDNRTWLQGFDSATGRFTHSVQLPGANIVMSVAEDVFEAMPGNGRFFWVGTYHSGGAKLFRVDLAAGKAEERGSWRGVNSSYVRSLSVSPGGVAIGIGPTAAMHRLTSPCSPKPTGTCPNPAPWSSATSAMSGASFAYASSSARIPDVGDITVVGTEQPATAIVLNQAGDAVLAQHAFPTDTTVDRVSIDTTTARAWFTTRPFGTLYSLDLKAPQQPPVRHDAPVFAAETRGLLAANGIVQGVSGTSETWVLSPDESSGIQPTFGRLIDSSQELVDWQPQGLVQFAGRTLVAGHWRYQIHGDPGLTNIAMPGEPKAQVVVGGDLYAAIYPSATIVRVDENMQTEQLTVLGPGQMRPAAIAFNASRDRLVVAAGPSYGKYGGALSMVSREPGVTPAVFTSPVGKHQVSAVSAETEDIFLGTWPKGETLPYLPGEIAQVKSWSPDGNENSGTTLWSRAIPGAAKVTSVQVIDDARGGFLLAAGFSFADNTGWFAGIEKSSGALLWHQSVRGSVHSVDVGETETLAIVGNTIMRVGASQSGLVLTPAQDQPGSFEPTFAAWDNGGTAPRIAHVTAGNAPLLRYSQQTNSRTIARVSGLDRYSTAVAVSRETYTKANTVLLASGNDYPDALVAGPLAAALDAPLLLANGGRITQETKDEISRLGAKRVVPIGGTGVLPNSVQKTLPSGAKLDTAARLSGDNRYETALSVAKSLERVTGRNNMEAFVVSGSGFADALTAGAAAIHSDRAVVLYDSYGAARPVRAFLKGKQIHALGGDAATALKQAGIPATSVVGIDRFETASMVAERYFAGQSARPVYVVNGLDFPDGLSAGVLAGRTNGPLLLSRASVLPPQTRDALVQGFGKTRLYLVGGEGVLSPALLAPIRDTAPRP